MHKQEKKFKPILCVQDNKSSSSTEDVGLHFGHYKLHQYYEINIRLGACDWKENTQY
jgi:hypothetical protein